MNLPSSALVSVAVMRMPETLFEVLTPMMVDDACVSVNSRSVSQFPVSGSRYSTVKSRSDSSELG
ncbi:MAG: hypothetical protein LIQ31_14695 [Planctomycetes bacterium]|nr:hypothetical protein [Planctomycetota bacterium]